MTDISSTHHKDGKNKKYNFATEHFYEETKKWRDL